ncbi:MAG: ferric reductase-like transmembrane domain-containing protein [Candidatus Dojkabacteria bacterium]
MRRKLSLFAIFACLVITFNLFVIAAPNIDFYIEEYTLAIAKLTGLWGFVLLGITFFLSGRWAVVDYAFEGQDQSYKWHHNLGRFALAVTLLHPIFLIYRAIPNSDRVLELLLPVGSLDVSFGILALYGFIFLITLTVLVSLPYRLWKATHIFMSFPLLLAGLHIFFVDGIVRQDAVLFAWMAFFFALGIFSQIFRRLIYPFLYSRTYKVKTIEHIEKGVIWDIWLEATGRVHVFAPGQYFFAKFYSKGLKQDEHPFSVANFDASGKVVRLGIKNLGDFTSKLSSLSIGDYVELMGPHGGFGDAYLENLLRVEQGNASSEQKHMVLIGGGIGVTPILSLLDHAKQNAVQAPITVYYSTVKAEEAVYEKEIKEAISALPNASYIPFPEETKGFLSAEQILEDTKADPKDILAFICGPPGMMSALRSQLLAKGTPSAQIISEDFGFK